MLKTQVKRYIITGPPGSGKSTLIEELRQAGCNCMDEISRQVIWAEQQAGGDGMPWKDVNRFTRLVFEQTVLQLPKDQGVVFHDRGLPDNIAYLKEAKVQVPDYLANFPFHDHYESTVFYAPVWKEIYINDPQRPDAFEAIQALDMQLRKTYELLGFQLMELPFGSLEERLGFVLSVLEEKGCLI